MCIITETLKHIQEKDHMQMKTLIITTNECSFILVFNGTLFTVRDLEVTEIS